MVIHCPIKSCGVAFDQDEYGANQMVAHLKGSHGMAASEAEFLPTIATPQKNVISKAETTETYTDKPKEEKKEEVKVEQLIPQINKKK